MGSKSPTVILMMVTLACAILPALGAALPPSTFAQQEETSLGEEEEETLADDIVSNVSDDADVDDENINPDDETNQDLTDTTATPNQNQEEQIIDQSNFAEDDAANLGLQDQGAAQEQDAEQDATQEDFDFDVQVGEAVQQSQQQPPQTEEPPPPPPPEEEDTTPPTLTVPEDITVEATSPEGEEVSFEVTAQDNVDGTATLDENNMLIQDDVGGDITISCDPPPGSTFPIGSTTVECTATDAAGNIGRASFTVTVNPAPDESTVITITGTTSGENIHTDEDIHDAEICSPSAGVVVTGPGVTHLGQTPFCQEDYGWDISPDPDGLDTTYRVDAKGTLGGGLNVDVVEVREGFSETDNDVYSLDANQFAMFDGPGDDRYDLVGVLEHPVEESVIYSDSTGNDRVTFSEEE